MTATAISSLGEVTEVPEKAKRRTYTAEYKLQIVKAAEACKGPGDIGALLRREGLYSSHLTTWRQARDRGELAPGAKAKKRNRGRRQLPDLGRRDLGTGRDPSAQSGVLLPCSQEITSRSARQELFQFRIGSFIAVTSGCLE
jgi:transposase